MNAAPINSAGFDVLFGILAVFIFLVMLSAWRRRESIANTARWLFITISCYLLTFFIGIQFTRDWVKVLLAALLVEVIVATRTKPKKKSRYISRIERRKAIARYERSGRRYDPRRHHLDHVIPHSRGGSNKADNLRVLEGEDNLAKSDKAPWWDVFSR